LGQAAKAAAITATAAEAFPPTAQHFLNRGRPLLAAAGASGLRPWIARAAIAGATAFIAFTVRFVAFATPGTLDHAAYEAGHPPEKSVHVPLYRKQLRRKTVPIATIIA
jgi:hypothetical protein